MKWIDYEYNPERGCRVYQIKHKKLLKFLGFRLHMVAAIADYEFRMSYLHFGYSPAPLQMSSRKLAIPILFMRRDHGLFLGKSKRHESYDEDGAFHKVKYHTELTFRIY